MSNEEKIRIERYKQRRQKLIILQAAIIAVLSIVLVLLFSSYQSVDQVSYVNYFETSKISYKVSLTDDELYEYEEGELGEDYAFVSSLIKNISANFSYNVTVDSQTAEIDYTYKIDAKLVIVDKTTNKEIYKPVYSLVEEKTGTINSNKLNLNETVVINYNQYNSEVINFVNTLRLNSTTSKLVVTATVKFTGACDQGVGADQKQHSFDLIIPLNEVVTDIKKSNTVTNSEKVLSCEQIEERKALIISLYVVGGIDLLAILVLLIYTLATKNSHINYSNKVNRIVKAYKSFIQKINNQFDMSEYQVLQVDTINEMLEIRDTLQSPILMSENEDRTMTKFIIPGNNNLLYVHEIKIENYDDIYGVKDEEMVEEPKEELVEVEPTIELDPIVETQEIEVVNNQEEKIEKTIYGHNYSFEAKLSLSKEEVKNYYQTVTKFAKEYGVKVSRSFKKERIHLGRKHIATMVFKGKTLCILFPLDPKDPAHEKYNFVDMSGYSKYEENPSMIKITSNRKLKTVIQIIEKVLIENGIEDKNLVVKDTKIKLKSKKTLLKEGLIKVNN